MKWKKLYSLDPVTVAHKAAVIVLGAISVALFTDIILTLMLPEWRALYESQSYETTVTVEYKEYQGGIWGGFYHCDTDNITTFRRQHKDVLENIVHELKHADNTKKFHTKLNTDANELSAYLAQKVYILGRDQDRLKRHRQQDSLKAAWKNAEKALLADDYLSPMEKLARQRMKKNKDYLQIAEKQNAAFKNKDMKALEECYNKTDSIFNETVQQLRQERQHLIDSISQRFFLPTRDFVTQLIEDKYDEKSVARKVSDIYWNQIEQLNDDFSPIERTVFERDFNYKLLELNQEQIDSIFTEAMQRWRNVRPNYTMDLKNDTLYPRFVPRNDAALKRLFTYKINGEHRSLFREASPKIQQQVRQMVNGDSLMFVAKNNMDRE